MRKYTTIILIIGISLFGIHYSQEDMKQDRLNYLKRIEILRDTKSYKIKEMGNKLFSNIITSSQKILQIQKDDHVIEYYNKFENLGLYMGNSLRNLFYYFKINLNAYEEFLKEGIDLFVLSVDPFEYLTWNPDYSLKLEVLRSCVVVNCQIVKKDKDVNDLRNKLINNFEFIKEDFTSYDRIRQKIIKQTNINRGNSYLFNNKYTLKIIDVLKGEDYFEKLPEFMLLYREEYEESNSLKLNRSDGGMPIIPLNIGDKLIAIYNPMINEFYNLDKNTILNSELLGSFKDFSDIYGNNDFILNTLELLRIMDNGIVLNQLDSLRNYGTFTEVQKTIKRIEKINDTSNFYKRSYK